MQPGRFQATKEAYIAAMKGWHVSLLRFTLFLIIFCITVLIAGCGHKDNSNTNGTSNPSPGVSKPTYRIGLGPWIGFGPLYLAKEKGFFDAAGVNVDLTVLTGVTERNSALKAGRIDGLAAPVDYFVLSAGNGLPNKIVMAMDESAGGDGIVAKPSIQRFEDLRGKKVAYQRGLPSEFFLRALLQKSNVKFDELQTVDMETAAAGGAFLAGKLDAACVWEPWLTKAKEGGRGHILASTKEHPNLIVDCLAFTNNMVEHSPGDAQKIVDAVLKAIDYWKQNPDDADKIMAPHFDVPPAKYAVILSGARFCDLARNKEFFGNPSSPGSIFEVSRQASSIWNNAKVIQTSVDPASIITAQFVQGAK